MTSLWLLPLGVGAAGAVALGVVGRRLAVELEALHEAMRPLRSRSR